jgi:hypothetical protein
MRRRGWLFAVMLVVVALVACSDQVEQEIKQTLPVTATRTSQIVAVMSETPPPPVTPRPTITERPTPTKKTSPTLTATVCLEGLIALEVPARTDPLEVYWLSDGDLWTWSEGNGQSWQVTEMGDVVSFNVAPDNRTIALKRSDDLYQSTAPYQEEIWAVERDGSNPRSLLTAEQIADFGAVNHEAYAGNSVEFSEWKEDNSQVIFSVNPVINAIGERPLPIGFWVIDVNSGQVGPGQSPPAEHDLALSPDGLYYYVVGDDSLAICRTEVHTQGTGCQENVIRYPRGPYEGDAWWYGYSIAWSPDSKLLKAVFPSVEYGGTSNTGELVAYEIPVAGRGPIKTAVFEAAPFLSYLSPSQEALLFWKPVKPGSNTWELHVARFDGSADAVYATGDGLEISGWAPDSVHFVYWLRGARLGSVCGEAVPLADELDARLVTWVDGDRFLFVSGYQADQQGELRLGQVGAVSSVLGPFEGKGAYYEVSE